jgi:hypothetical protein
LGIRLGTQRLDGLLQLCDDLSGNADGVRHAALTALTARPAFTLWATVPAWAARACRPTPHSLRGFSERASLCHSGACDDSP